MDSGRQVDRENSRCPVDIGCGDARELYRQLCISGGGVAMIDCVQHVKTVKLEIDMQY